MEVLINAYVTLLHEQFNFSCNNYLSLEFSLDIEILKFSISTELCMKEKFVTKGQIQDFFHEERGERAWLKI